MILNRLGKKDRIADKITPLFPKHEAYIEPFFGAGGMFFSKERAKYNFLNDKDSEVFNLFMVLSEPEQKNNLLEWLELMPVSQDLYRYWKKNQETSPVRKAMRFLFLSNFGLYGGAGSLGIGFENTKDNLLEKIKHFVMLKTQFTNVDFRKVFDNIRVRTESELERTFVYNDPPYLGKGHNYESGFTEQDSIDLFDTLANFGAKWAMSEYSGGFAEEEAHRRGLWVTNIGEVQSIRNRNTEILITNYKPITYTQLGFYAFQN